MMQRIDGDVTRDAEIRYLTRMLDHARDEIVALSADLNRQGYSNINFLLTGLRRLLSVRYVGIPPPQVAMDWYEFTKGTGPA